MQFSTTKKNRALLFLAGYTYHLDKLKTKAYRWRCFHRTCKGFETIFTVSPRGNCE